MFAGSRIFVTATVVLNLLSAPSAICQQPEPTNAPAFKAEELEQLLAPIALYPDELIAQILTAATYPLEIVMAARWVADPKNAALKGDALAQALEGQSWDASVKSLVPFPSVLKMMSDKLDWTQKLGDAFLGQEEDCLAAVQTLRRKAQAAGTLKSTPQQKVTVQPRAAPTQTAPASTTGGPAVVAPVTEEPTIAIEPANPQEVYVPYYDPAAAYGAWPYPAYPPYAFPPPLGYGVVAGLATGLAFGAGVAVTSSLWGWGRPNWGGGNITINSNQFNRINANRTVISGTPGSTIRCTARVSPTATRRPASALAVRQPEPPPAGTTVALKRAGLVSRRAEPEDRAPSRHSGEDRLMWQPVPEDRLVSRQIAPQAKVLQRMPAHAGARVWHNTPTSAPGSFAAPPAPAALPLNARPSIRATVLRPAPLHNGER